MQSISLSQPPLKVENLDLDLDCDALERLAKVRVPEPIKEPVADHDINHRSFRSGDFWQRIPQFRDVTEDQFLDWKFQNQNSVRTPEQLMEFLKGLVDESFIEDVRQGLAEAPMNMRLSPYILSVINWGNPYSDPVRTQFIPVHSTRLVDHPMLTLDSLHERKDSPTSGLVHRYPDKALFLPLDVCPVYCRFCTRSYAIGGDTDSVDKHRYQPNNDRWDQAFAYIASRPEIEDIVVSGGDAYMLSPQHLRHFAETLLAMPHIRRIRFATKGPAVMPMKILTHDEWTDTLIEVTELGRDRCKEVCLHTHFNTVNEVSDISRRAMNYLFRNGVKVRNQAVHVRGVNNDAEQMVHLTRKLSFMNVQPYYVYQHDMVKGVEELRTTLKETLEIERNVRGATAGFNTPTFVCDVPGGGGKRDAHSFDYYNETTGISIYRSPNVDDKVAYMYFDPIGQLSDEGKALWAESETRDKLISQALEEAGMEDYVRAR